MNVPSGYNSHAQRRLRARKTHTLVPQWDVHFLVATVVAGKTRGGIDNEIVLVVVPYLEENPCRYVRNQGEADNAIS